MHGADHPMPICSTASPHRTVRGLARRGTAAALTMSSRIEGSPRPINPPCPFD
jgi:hypothetical protein